MFKIRKKSFTPAPAHVGLYFEYGAQQYKIIRVSPTGNYFFAWYSEQQLRVMTSELKYPGQSPEIFNSNVSNGNYRVINEKIIKHKELIDFKL